MFKGFTGFKTLPFELAWLSYTEVLRFGVLRL